MFSTKHNGCLFSYESWEKSNGTVSFHRDAGHMISMVFYNQSLKLTGRSHLTVRQWMWHVACLEAYWRAVA